jgi:PqqD family protein of HPr-rel-A system
MTVARPRVRDSAAAVEIDGEAVVYDATRGQVHYLNHSAALVLDLCDGTATEDEMAAAIADVYEMPVGEVGEQVRGAVDSLRELGLLEVEPEDAVGAGPAADGDSPTGPTPDEDAPPGEVVDGGVDARGLVRMEVPRSD